MKCDLFVSAQAPQLSLDQAGLFVNKGNWSGWEAGVSIQPGQRCQHSGQLLQGLLLKFWHQTQETDRGPVYTHCSGLGCTNTHENTCSCSVQICKMTLNVFFLLCGKSFVASTTKQEELRPATRSKTSNTFWTIGKRGIRCVLQCRAAWSLQCNSDFCKLWVTKELF